MGLAGMDREAGMEVDAAEHAPMVLPGVCQPTRHPLHRIAERATGHRRRAVSPAQAEVAPAAQARARRAAGLDDRRGRVEPVGAIPIGGKTVARHAMAISRCLKARLSNFAIEPELLERLRERAGRGPRLFDLDRIRRPPRPFPTPGGRRGRGPGGYADPGHRRTTEERPGRRGLRPGVGPVVHRASSLRSTAGAGRAHGRRRSGVRQRLAPAL